MSRSDSLTGPPDVIRSAPLATRPARHLPDEEVERLETSAGNRPAKRSPSGTVRFVNDAALVSALANGSSDAAALLYDRFVPLVDRTLLRLLGPDSELEDIRHEVFLRAITSIRDLKDPQALAGWLRGIAVLAARQVIDKRTRRRRWLFWLPPEDLPEVATLSEASRCDERDEVRAVYAVLDKLPTEERLVLTLRRIDERELAEIAEELQLSLATVKRRLKRATERFDALARANRTLMGWASGGDA
jgi:RNA polymerase sigma-70 factor, ECF subfamily